MVCRNVKITWLLFLVMIIPLFLLCNSSCNLICVEANLSPEALVDSNDYVILGEPVSVDTLADLGMLERLDREMVAYIIEYAYKPREVFKAAKQIDYIYLWWCVTIRLKDGYYNAPKIDSLELIYGNDILTWDSVIYLYMPNLVWAGEIPILRDWVNGNPPKSRWASASGDSTLIARIMAATHLEPLLAERNRKGQVIYATEKGYYTHDSFHDDDLMYCDCMWCPPRLFISRSDYVGKLRSLAQ